IRGNYAALVAMCDDYFGRLLDYFDKHDLWQDTALVLTTDHGFLLSEHQWWGKNRMPYYEEISHIPLMIHHPDHIDQAGTRRQALTQTTDLMPTFLDFHNAAPLPREVTGSSLGSILKKDEPARESVILGMFSGPLCVNDGRFSYFRYPKDLSGENLNLYTLMPAHLSRLFDIDELKTAQLVEPFDFTKEAPLLKIRMDPRNSQTGNDGAGLADTQSVLFDLQTDPDQLHPLEDAQKIAHMVALAGKELARHDAPQEIFDFYDIPNPNMKSQEKEAETA
ncbi:MAG: sulfatase-like hydrolase/transferase, partial [Cohaesibacter sp.]|nr:sulfatase-like hydrolase/transferase [Cohaesibacter sp.]